MLRNNELRRFACLLFAVSAVAATVGFCIHPAAGVLSLASSAALVAAFFLFTRRRYARIAQISEQIDRVLHNADCLRFEEAEEGELAILQSEIAKMTLRIREQNDALRREKQHLSDSLADIAHQLRTPLTSANLILSLLESAPDERKRKALLREASELFSQMDWLLTALLQVARLDAGVVAMRSEPVAVDALLDAAARPLLIPMELRGIALKIDAPANSTVTGDLPWLAEAIRNILKNCMESAGEHGTIAISCADNPLYTELTIRDSGPGFDEAELPRLFERFYRGSRSSAGGCGVGLALCRTIIKRQGGTVAAKNHPRGGALFTLRFPK